MSTNFDRSSFEEHVHGVGGGSGSGPGDGSGGAGTAHAHCPHCLVSPGQTKSAKLAWGIAVAAVLLLVAVFALGVGSTGGTLLAATGIPLFALLLLCPLVMGGMMMFMMRKGN